MQTPLPVQSTPFIGRGEDLANVQRLLGDSSCRLVTVIGLGGSGKTRLAIEVTHQAAAHFQHGIIFVAMQSLTQSDLLVPAIAQAAGLTFYSGDEPEIQLFNFLREKSLLLVLDNFEHLLDASVIVGRILAHTLAVKVLVTSREPLNLQEEWRYPLKGMEIPASVYSTALEDYEAVRLFLYHAQRMQPAFVLAGQAEPIFHICKLAEGLPLAIELAASWLKGLSAAQIAAEMKHNLDFLSTRAINVEERHRSIRAVFDHSWKLLADDERLSFARLTIFQGGFSGDAARQIAGASYPILVSLVEKSLIQMESADRFSIHELLRQYGREQLEIFGEADATHSHHSAYFASLMLQYEISLKQPQQLETMGAIEDDIENIRLAWEWSLKNQQVNHLHAMLNGLYLFGFLRSRYGEIIPIFQRSLEQSIDDASLLGRLLARRWGYLHWWYEADHQKALHDIAIAQDIALAQDNRFEMAFCHLISAYIMISTQRYREAVPHLEASKSLFDEINEPYYVCWVLHRLGYVYFNLNEQNKGNEYTGQSLALARVTHNKLALVICLYNLGSNYILDRDYAKGKHYCAEALQVATESGHQGQIAHALSLLALCAFCEADYDACQSYAQRSYSLTEEINLLAFQPYNLALLILLACLAEDYGEGLRLSELGKHYKTNTMGLQLLYWALASLACGFNNRAEARTYIEKVFNISVPEPDPAIAIWLVPATAYTLAETAPHKAVELLSWVFAYPDTALNWGREWPLFRRFQLQLQETMSSDVYQRHWEKGKSLSFDVVRSYLQHEFGQSSEIPDFLSYQQRLTPREDEILRLMAAGMTNPQIAAELFISAGTVKTHTLSIYRKLDVANRTQAIIRAQELGLLSA